MAEVSMEFPWSIEVSTMERGGSKERDEDGSSIDDVGAKTVTNGVKDSEEG